MINNDKRVRFFVGHYGSGKTEVSVNYAVKLQEEGKNVALVDLDVVNLYFRSRERKQALEDLGIKVIGSSIDASAVDIPAVAAETIMPLQNENYEGVIDVGGDPVGARALGRFKDFFQEEDYDMFFVLNANRPETQTVDKALEYIRKIEDTSRAKITGIINNTHMLKSTTVEDVMKGQKLAEELAEKADIPVKYIIALEEIAEDIPEDVEGEVFPIKLFMRDEWMI